MRKTAIQQLRDKKRAEIAGAAAAKQKPTTERDLLNIQFVQDKRTLKSLRGIKFKTAKKRELYPNYAPYIQSVLAADQGGDDELLMHLFVWTIDIGEFLTAIQIAEYASKHQLSMPENYSRSVGEVLAEQAAQEYLAGIDIENDLLATIVEMTAELDMLDEIRSKLHKAYGRSLAREERYADAIEHLEKALEYNPNAGVKQDIARAKKQLDAEKGDEKPED